VSALGSLSPRVVALYFPHFYPGSGSSAAESLEAPGWRLVAQAEALFPGHEQPRRPADLGYGDLRVPEVRLAQADLARAYGVDAFCYYHYWSLGRRLFARPFAEVLAAGEPDFPFCLLWSNASWPELGFTQAYSGADELEHAAFLAEAFADRRYLRVDGRPVFAIRHPDGLAGAPSALEAIRTAARRRGAGDPLFVGARGPSSACGTSGDGELRRQGFDALLDWPLPAWEASQGVFASADPAGLPPSRVDLRAKLRNLFRRRRWLPDLRIEGEIEWRARAAARGIPEDRLTCALVGWDDTPVHGRRGTVLDERSPQLFKRELETALVRSEAAAQAAPLVFIYAWNAWLEGAALEPDERFGRAYLASVAFARLQAEKQAGHRGEAAR
jgi:hypothetical protein